MTITWSLVISSWLSVLFLCFFLVKGISPAPHLGQISSSQLNVRGHFPGCCNVSQASELDTSLSTDLSGSLQVLNKYSAVLWRYFWVFPHSNLCLSQSSSWKICLTDLKNTNENRFLCKICSFYNVSFEVSKIAFLIYVLTWHWLQQ